MFIPFDFLFPGLTQIPWALSHSLNGCNAVWNLLRPPPAGPKPRTVRGRTAQELFTFRRGGRWIFRVWQTEIAGVRSTEQLAFCIV